MRRRNIRPTTILHHSRSTAKANRTSERHNPPTGRIQVVGDGFFILRSVQPSRESMKQLYDRVEKALSPDQVKILEKAKALSLAKSRE